MRLPSSIFCARLRLLLLGFAAGLVLGALSFGAETASAVTPAPTPVSTPSDEARFVRPLIVPTPIDSYPYSFLDSSGKCVGFSTEMLDAAARAMDLKLKRVIAPAKLAESEFDIIQTFTHTSEREKAYDFSVPYFELQGTLVVRKDKNLIHSISDLNGRELAIVGRGGPGDSFVAKYHLGGVHRVYYNTVQEAVFALNSGRHDAVFASRLTTLSVIEYFKLGNVRPLGLPVEGFNMPLCFAMHKGDAMLLARLDEGIAILHRTGEYDKIYNKWFGRFEPVRFTREQILIIAPTALGLALIAALWGLKRQRQLRRQLARQANEIVESHAILAEAQQFAHIGHWQRSFDRAQPAVWSEETYRILEQDPKNGPLTFGAILRLVLPEDRKRWLAEMRRSRSEGNGYSTDVRLEFRPGLRKILHVRARPVRDARSQSTGFFGTVQDVTEWREVERAQREASQLLRTIYENATYAMGVFTLDEKNKCAVVSVNPEARRLFGLLKDPAPGRTIAELGLTPEQISFWTELFQRCQQSGVPLKLSLRHGAVQLALTLVPLDPDENGRWRVCLIAEDITERVQKDAEIAQSRRLRAIGEMVGGIAHEFNNLLTPILLKADALNQHLNSQQPDLADEMKIIIDASTRAAEITRRLLTFGRKTDRRPEVIRLRAAIENDLDLLRHTVDRRIQIDCTIPSDLPPLWLPSTDLHQIVVNLLLNARDTLVEKLSQDNHSGWNPRICIEACTAPPGAAAPIDSARGQAPLVGWARLTVRDNGLGIPPAVLERIFEPFYTTKRVGQGTGLGLATVWHLLTELGGRVDVESTPGSGTAFHIWLPIGLASDTATKTDAAPPTHETGASTGLRVLVVDDEESISLLVRVILERQGHTVMALSDGRTALEKISAEPDAFDALLVDFNMPGLTGLELVRHARELPFHGTVVVMSGHLSNVERIEFARLGVEHIIQKPFTLTTFVNTLAAAGLKPAQPVATA